MQARHGGHTKKVISTSLKLLNIKQVKVLHGGLQTKKSSITNMIKELGWDTLETRRQKARLTMMFKIANDLVGIFGTYKQLQNQETQQQQLSANLRQTQRHLQIQLFSKNNSRMELIDGQHGYSYMYSCVIFKAPRVTQNHSFHWSSSVIRTEVNWRKKERWTFSVESVT